MRLIERVFRRFEGWIDPFKPLEDYEPPNRLVAYVWFYVAQAKWAFLALLVLGLLTALLEALVFSYVGQVVDLLTGFESSGEKARGWTGLMEQYGGLLLSMLVVVILLRLLVIALDALVEEQTIVPGFFILMRWQSHKHIIGQSLSFFQNDLAGRISQKVFQSGMATGDMMISLLQIIWFITVYAVTTAGVLFALDWQLGAIVVAWMLAFYFVARYFIPRVREHAKITADTGSGISGRMVDAYANIQTVKLHGTEKSEEDGVLNATQIHRKEIFKFTRILTMLRISANFVSAMAISLIGIMVIDLWLADQTSLGSVAFVLAMSLRLRLLLNRLLGNLNGFFRNVGVTQNTMELIAQPHGIRDVPDALDFEFRNGEIRIENLTFHYDRPEGALNDLSLNIKPGEKIGIVGSSGSGKTTLIHLLMRFFEPQSGRILIDGQDITKVKQDSLRQYFSFVQQDVQMFHRTVYKNIAYGMPDISKAKVEAAAKLANAHEFILELKDNNGATGYDSQIGERGVKLSGGQRQRIAIARALLREAPILILDEATSQLDSNTEKVIQGNLLEQMEGKTVIVIAHRLSTIAKMDRLIVLDNGKIVESGSHDQLIKTDGLYSAFWKKQALH
ncbi:MAG: ABC transporter ATP-binding protein [Pseudomonadota bacterium]